MAENGRAPPWLDKDFVQRALREGDVDFTTHVTCCDVSLAYAEGDGYGSDMYRVTARLADSQDRRLIVKCQPQGGARGDFVILVNAYDKESKMLSDTLPAMSKLLEAANPGKYEPFGPKSLLLGKDPLKFIVMEDLCESGFVLPKRVHLLDLNHCTMTIKRLARFHAASVVLHDRSPASIECYEENMYSELGRRHMKPLMMHSMEALIDEVSNWPGYEKYVGKLEKLKESLFDRILPIYKRKDEDFNTLIHGDFWINNLMFRYSGNIPTDMRILDYQAVYFSSPVLDLHHFLNTCLSDEVRFDHADNLIQQYYNTLTETLRLLGYTKEIISYERLQKKFRDSSLYGFAMAAIVLPAVMSEDVFDVETVFTDDRDGVNPNRNMLSNKKYVDTMKRLLPVYEQAGVI